MQGALSCSLHQNLALYGSQFLIYDALQILNNFTYFLLCALAEINLLYCQALALARSSNSWALA